MWNYKIAGAQLWFNIIISIDELVILSGFISDMGYFQIFRKECAENMFLVNSSRNDMLKILNFWTPLTFTERLVNIVYSFYL